MKNRKFEDMLNQFFYSWHRPAVTGAIALVVFITTYALVLPAITLTTDKQVLDCDYQVHQHTDSCYADQPVYDSEGRQTGTQTVLVCGKADYVIHVHDDNCYQDGQLVCTLPEIQAHQHDKSCYTEEKVLACTLAEEEGHQHDDSCYTESQSLICELEDHDHDESCYQTERELTCTKPESEGHMHSDSCYMTNINMTCSLPELHTHTSACFENSPNGQPICGKTELLAHQHGQSCFSLNQTVTTEPELQEETSEETAFETEFTEETADESAVETAEETADNTADETETITETEIETEAETETDPDTFTVPRTVAAAFDKTVPVDGADYSLKIAVSEDCGLPKETVFKAVAITENTDDYDNYAGMAVDAVAGETDHRQNDCKAMALFDLSIYDSEGNELQPQAPISVTVAFDDQPKDQENNEDAYAVHFPGTGMDENGAITQKDETAPAEAEVIYTAADKGSISFEADSFSVYAVVYTVDFHYEVDGKTYETSIIGGDFISFRKLISVLGICDDPDRFTEDVEHVTFSSPELVSVSKAETDTTVGAMKEELGLDCIYSADLSEAEIDLINAQEVKAGDWAMISVLPFDTDEYLTVEMNTGEVFTIYVTDAQAGGVTIHYVDRNGNPLSVDYKGHSTNVNRNADGTFYIPYTWKTTGTIDLSKDFQKTGYTYASTHLAGTREGVSYTYDGLTIDAKLTEQYKNWQYGLYLTTDAVSNRGYNSLVEYNVNSEIKVPYADGRADQSIRYSPANTGKDIYVIMDPVPVGSIEQQNPDLDVQDPEFNKTLEYNEDGTYTLSLNVKGHGINAATNPKANVIFVVDTSSSMTKTEGTGTGHTRLEDTKPALKKLGKELLLSNTMSGRDPDTVEVAMVSFDGGVVDEMGWKTSYADFENTVNNGLKVHRGTDWEDGLQRAYDLGLAKQAEEPDQQVFVIFFTDGEASQYRNFHGQGSPTVDKSGYWYWYSYFLSRESAKDEARAIVNAGMQFYAIYAFNKDGDKYNGEAGSDLLRNLVKYGYNTSRENTVQEKHFFAKATSTQELNDAFNSILLSIREFLGFSDVVMTDDITSLTSTGINLTSSAVGGFTYTRSGGRFGSGQVWTDAPAATHTDTAEGDVRNVHWDLGTTVLEEGITYTVSFKVWPSQEAYDWLANLNNGTKTWADVVAAGLDAPNGENAQIVRNGSAYSLLTNKPSLNSDGQIINNSITYRKIHSETVTAESIPAGTQMNKPYEGRDDQGNKTITTYTFENDVYTKKVVTEKETYFKNPDPMPLLPERMNVLKVWENSMNTSHPADELKFRVLVDGKYYQNDGTFVAGDAGQANAKVLPVSGRNSWQNSIEIALGIVKFYDDDGNALSEALVLETGHKYTVEEFDLKEGGSDFLYYTSYEFHAQTMRPMIVDGTLKYLVLIDAANPAPANAETVRIGSETYYVAGSGSGNGTLSGTNYRTAELDISKIINNQSGVELTDEELDAQTFTYRVSLSIPDGTDPAGIVGYEYVPRTGEGRYTLYGYQNGETAFDTDIERFAGKTFGAWNTLVYRDLVEWENIGGRIVSKTDANGDIIWKVAKDADGYHTITYDMTLNRNEVIRFTNLPTGTKYSIQEIYANYYKADNEEDPAGHAPAEKVSNIADEGYEISQVLSTNGTVSKTVVSNDTVTGTIDTPNVRYYNQYTNDLKSVKTEITILKTDQTGSKPLSGAVFDLYDVEGFNEVPKAAFETDLVSSDEEVKEGTIELGSLPEGVYYLVETSAPAGYILLEEPVVITISQGDVSYSQANTSIDDNGTGKTGDYKNGFQLKVVNDAGAVLPNTGGPGIRLYYFFGAVLIMMAGSLLILRKRRDSLLLIFK